MTLRTSMHSTHGSQGASVCARRDTMHANDVRSTEVLRHGAYLCFRVPAGARAALARVPVPGLAERLGLRNEFEPGGNHPTDAVAFLRRVGATSADIEDEALLHADVVVHVAAPTAG